MGVNLMDRYNDEKEIFCPGHGLHSRSATAPRTARRSACADAAHSIGAGRSSFKPTAPPRIRAVQSQPRRYLRNPRKLLPVLGILRLHVEREYSWIFMDDIPVEMSSHDERTWESNLSPLG